MGKYVAEVIPPNMTPSPLKGPLGGQVIEGPNLSSIVGNPGDNYTNGPAGVASFFLPTISNPQREFLPHPTSYTGNQRGVYR